MTNPTLERPTVTLKLATSLDGRIATRTGHSKWITGGGARAHVHQMRAGHDCVLTGIGTVLADDPELTARFDPMPAKQPLRVVLDSKARTSLNARLLSTQALGPVCLFHEAGHATAQVSDGVQRLYVDRSRTDEGLDLHQVLTALFTQFQVRSIMVEAGAGLAGAFMRAKLVDTLVWFRAPLVIGGDGLSVFASLGIDNLSDALAFDCIDFVRLGDDVMETYNLRA